MQPRQKKKILRTTSLNSKFTCSYKKVYLAESCSAKSGLFNTKSQVKSVNTFDFSIEADAIKPFNHML